MLKEKKKSPVQSRFLPGKGKCISWWEETCAFREGGIDGDQLWRLFITGTMSNKNLNTTSSSLIEQ